MYLLSYLPGASGSASSMNQKTADLCTGGLKVPVEDSVSSRVPMALPKDRLDRPVSKPAEQGRLSR